ncbi:MAG: PQQ-binding-like beta-propeller repeat protein, partial [Planctomycetota bacterium]
VDCGQQLTAEPAVLDGRLWLAGGRGIFGIAGVDAEPQRYWMSQGGDAAEQRLENPVYAPPTWQEGRVQITTRDRLVLDVDPASGTVTRRGIPAETNLPVTVFHSSLIVDRTLDIIVDLEQVVQALDRRSSTVVWTHARDGVDIVCRPVLHEGRLLLIYADGSLVALDPDNGDLLLEDDIGEEVAAAWAMPDGIHAYAGTRWLRWDGDRLAAEPLPAIASAGAAGVLLSRENRAYVHDGSAWQQVGVHREPLSAPPLQWQGHAVLASGAAIEILGPRPFSIVVDGYALAPCVLGEHLAIVGSDGRVRLYAP